MATSVAVLPVVLPEKLARLLPEVMAQRSWRWRRRSGRWSPSHPASRWCRCHAGGRQREAGRGRRERATAVRAAEASSMPAPQVLVVQ
jgi:hypothetical protein